MKETDEKAIPVKAGDVPILGLCQCKHCAGIRRRYEQSLKPIDWPQDVDDEKKTFPRKRMD